MAPSASIPQPIQRCAKLAGNCTSIPEAFDPWKFVAMNARSEKSTSPLLSKSKVHTNGESESKTSSWKASAKYAKSPKSIASLSSTSYTTGQSSVCTPRPNTASAVPPPANSICAPVTSRPKS